MVCVNDTRKAILIEKGYSLVEVTVALMIFSMLVIPLSVMFTTTFASIASSGTKSESVYEIQGEAEKYLAGEGDHENIETVEDTITFFPGNFNLEGEEVTFTKELPEGGEVTVHMFVPEGAVEDDDEE